MSFCIKLIEGYQKLSIETCYNDFWQIWSTRAFKIVLKIHLNMTISAKTVNWRLSSLFLCNQSHYFDRNCSETPKPFIFYQFNSFVIILTCQSNQKCGKKGSKMSYFGSFGAHFGLCGTEERSYFSLNSLKCNIVIFLNRFYNW